MSTYRGLVSERRGCIGGLLELFLLTSIYNWMQENFGFGRGCSCAGLGCGFLLLVIFIFLLCGVILNTNWIQIGF